ncbi:Ig-like domain-containing protein [Neobacillus drentensis]|uniref:Ig-like domain-containing protein n=1 Tax=Neobacillus drentensis TaxID=220684 RepID=UPI002FFEC704
MSQKKASKGLLSLLSFLLVLSPACTNIVTAAEKDSNTISVVDKKDPLQPLNQLHKQRITQTTSFTPKNKKDYKADELIIKYKNSVSAANLKNKHSLKTEKKFKSIGAEVVKVENGANIESLVKTLEDDPAIAFVQPNYIYRAADVPNDPSFNKLWGLHNTGQQVNGASGVNDVDIDYPEAMQEFSKVTNQQQVVVGIIDTGIDINHPELIDSIWTNPGEIANNKIDDDGNGYIDDIHGWDFYHSDNSVFDAEDGDEHGTHVAGTIAAKSNNGIGISGIAPNVKIMSLKFLGADGSGNTSDAIQAIEYAKKMGVKITNNSWGGSEYDQALKDAIDQSNMLFIAAAGNDGLNNDLQPDFPASYNSPNVISVAAIDNSGKLAGFSNFGANSVDIAAPGTNILSTVPRKIEEGTAAQIYNSSYRYKAIFNGFGFENFAAADRQAAFAKAVSYLGLTSSSKILLVQDDEANIGNVNYLSIYTTLLNNAGLPYSLKTVSANENGPSLSTLSGYDTVIWFSGNAMGQVNPNLTSTDLSTLEQFLKRGNKSLVLSGQDLLYRNEDSYFVNTILGLTIKGEGETSAKVTGTAGTVYDGLSYSVSYAPYADYISSANEAITKVNLKFVAEETYTNAYAYLNGTSMATPHVTGVAALLAGKYPGIDPGKLKTIILASGADSAALTGKVATGKTLNARNALTYTPKPVVNDFTDKDTAITGQAEVGAKIVVKSNGSIIGEGNAIADGTFSVAIPVQKAVTELSITATDKDGNVSEPVTIIVKDVSAPVKPVVNGMTDKDTVVKGQTEGEARVEVKVNGTSIGSGTAGTDGHFTVNIPLQKAGTELVITATDQAGHVSEAAIVVVIDMTVPDKPIVNEVTDQAPYVTGQAEAGAVVEVKVNDSVIGTATADLNNKFMVTIPVQRAGIELVITATDTSGNRSEAAIVIIKDVTAPAKPLVYEVSDKDTRVEGQSEVGAKIEVKASGTVVGTGTVETDGKFSVSIPVQLAGAELFIIATDTSGNMSDATTVVVKETTAPSKQLIVNEVTDQDTTILGQAEAGANLEVKANDLVIGKGFAGTDGKFIISIPVQKADTELIITVIDQDGNAVESTSIMVKDVTSPLQPSVNNVTDQDTIVTGQAEAGAIVEVKVNESVIGTGTTETDGKFIVTIPVQTAGTKLVITATDPVGNISDFTIVEVIDKTAPAAPKVSVVSDKSNEISGTTEAGATVTVTIGISTFAKVADSDGNFKITIPIQTAGIKITITAADGNGNVSSVTTITVIDKTAPTLLTISLVSNKSNIITGTTEVGAIVTATIGTKKYTAFKADPKGSYKVIIPLQKAGTKIAVTTKDGVGNESTAKIITVLDKIAPSVPTVYTISNLNKVITGKAEAGAYIAVTIGSKKYLGKADSKGYYKVTVPVQKADTKLTVTAKDADGNISTAKYVTVVDKIAPSVPVVTTSVKSTTKEISGTAEAYATITIKVGKKVIGTTKVDSKGKYKVKIKAQKKKTVLSLTATDKARNVSKARTVKVK